MDNFEFAEGQGFSIWKKYQLEKLTLIYCLKSTEKRHQNL